MTDSRFKKSTKIILGICGVIIVVIIAAVSYQILSYRNVDRKMQVLLDNIEADVPREWAEHGRKKSGGGSLLSMSPRWTVSVDYKGTASSDQFRHILNSAGVIIEQCENSSFIVQCYGSLEGYGVGMSSNDSFITVTVSNRR